MNATATEATTWAVLKAAGIGGATSSTAYLVQSGPGPSLDGFVNWGIGGAVIATVMLFLKHLSQESKARRQYDRERDEHWISQLDSLCARQHKAAEESARTVSEALKAHAEMERRSYEENNRTHDAIVESLNGLMRDNTSEHSAIVVAIQRVADRLDSQRRNP